VQARAHTHTHRHTHSHRHSLSRVCVCVLSPSFCLSRAQGAASKGGVQNRCNGYPTIDKLETELSARYAKDKIEGAAAGMAAKRSRITPIDSLASCRTFSQRYHAYQSGSRSWRQEPSQSSENQGHLFLLGWYCTCPWYYTAVYKVLQ
jgi:hypothetical protein